MSYNDFMFKKKILCDRLKVLNRYIDKLEKCDEENRPLTDAYREIVNELRIEAGLKPLMSKEEIEEFKKKYIKNYKEEK